MGDTNRSHNRLAGIWEVAKYHDKSGAKEANEKIINEWLILVMKAIKMKRLATMIRTCERHRKDVGLELGAESLNCRVREVSPSGSNMTQRK